jgi:hypothetical protein
LLYWICLENTQINTWGWRVVMLICRHCGRASMKFWSFRFYIGILFYYFEYTLQISCGRPCDKRHATHRLAPSPNYRGKNPMY